MARSRLCPYLRTTHPNAHKTGYVAEHTKVMAACWAGPWSASKRCITGTGIRSDNRPENLELWARGLQPPGSRVSDLIDAAVRVLKQYRPELLAESTPDSKGSGEKELPDQS